MNNKLLIVGVIATTALLGGCSKNSELGDKVDLLTNQVSDLSTKVDGLAADHQMMSANTAAAASEADRANARMDNMVESYKK